MTTSTMILHRNADRGHSRWSWLDSRHSFSFDRFYDEQRMGFGALRVLNEDRVAPGAGFPTHPHRHMEILSLPLQGHLLHRDSTGSGMKISAGEVQLMSAGTGIRHSEYNGSGEEEAHFLQIWIQPDERGTAPAYHKMTPETPLAGSLQLLAGPPGAGGLPLRQQARVYRGRICPGEELPLKSWRAGNGLYVFLLEGDLQADRTDLHPGDGAGFPDGRTTLAVTEGAGGDAVFLLFDVPMNP